MTLFGIDIRRRASKGQKKPEKGKERETDERVSLSSSEHSHIHEQPQQQQSPQQQHKQPDQPYEQKSLQSEGGNNTEEQEEFPQRRHPSPLPDRKNGSSKKNKKVQQISHPHFEWKMERLNVDPITYQPITPSVARSSSSIRSSSCGGGASRREDGRQGEKWLEVEDGGQAPPRPARAPALELDKMRGGRRDEGIQNGGDSRSRGVRVDRPPPLGERKLLPVGGSLREGQSSKSGGSGGGGLGYGVGRAITMKEYDGGRRMARTQEMSGGSGPGPESPQGRSSPSSLRSVEQTRQQEYQGRHSEEQRTRPQPWGQQVQQTQQQNSRFRDFTPPRHPPPVFDQQRDYCQQQNYRPRGRDLLRPAGSARGYEPEDGREQSSPRSGNEQRSYQAQKIQHHTPTTVPPPNIDLPQPPTRSTSVRYDSLDNHPLPSPKLILAADRTHDSSPARSKQDIEEGADSWDYQSVYSQDSGCQGDMGDEDKRTTGAGLSPTPPPQPLQQRPSVTRVEEPEKVRSQHEGEDLAAIMEKRFYSNVVEPPALQPEQSQLTPSPPMQASQNSKRAQRRALVPPSPHSCEQLQQQIQAQEFQLQQRQQQELGQQRALQHSGAQVQKTACQLVRDESRRAIEGLGVISEEACQAEGSLRACPPGLKNRCQKGVGNDPAPRMPRASVEAASPIEEGLLVPPLPPVPAPPPTQTPRRQQGQEDAEEKDDTRLRPPERRALGTGVGFDAVDVVAPLKLPRRSYTVAVGSRVRDNFGDSNNSQECPNKFKRDGVKDNNTSGRGYHAEEFRRGRPVHRANGGDLYSPTSTTGGKGKGKQGIRTPPEENAWGIPAMGFCEKHLEKRGEEARGKRRDLSVGTVGPRSRSCSRGPGEVRQTQFRDMGWGSGSGRQEGMGSGRDRGTRSGRSSPAPWENDREGGWAKVGGESDGEGMERRKRSLKGGRSGGVRKEEDGGLFGKPPADWYDPPKTAGPRMSYRDGESRSTSTGDGRKPRSGSSVRRSYTTTAAIAATPATFGGGRDTAWDSDSAVHESSSSIVPIGYRRSRKLTAGPGSLSRKMYDHDTLEGRRPSTSHASSFSFHGQTSFSPASTLESLSPLDRRDTMKRDTLLPQRVFEPPPMGPRFSPALGGEEERKKSTGTGPSSCYSSELGGRKQSTGIASSSSCYSPEAELDTWPPRRQGDLGPQPTLQPLPKTPVQASHRTRQPKLPTTSPYSLPSIELSPPTTTTQTINIPPVPPSPSPPAPAPSSRPTSNESTTRPISTSDDLTLGTPSSSYYGSSSSSPLAASSPKLHATVPTIGDALGIIDGRFDFGYEETTYRPADPTADIAFTTTSTSISTAALAPRASAAPSPDPIVVAGRKVQPTDYSSGFPTQADTEHALQQNMWAQIDAVGEWGERYGSWNRRREVCDHRNDPSLWPSPVVHSYPEMGGSAGMLGGATLLGGGSRTGDGTGGESGVPDLAAAIAAAEERLAEAQVRMVEEARQRGDGALGPEDAARAVRDALAEELLRDMARGGERLVNSRGGRSVVSGPAAALAAVAMAEGRMAYEAGERERDVVPGPEATIRAAMGTEAGELVREMDMQRHGYGGRGKNVMAPRAQLRTSPPRMEDEGEVVAEPSGRGGDETPCPTDRNERGVGCSRSGNDIKARRKEWKEARKAAVLKQKREERERGRGPLQPPQQRRTQLASPRQQLQTREAQEQEWQRLGQQMREQELRRQELQQKEKEAQFQGASEKIKGQTQSSRVGGSGTARMYAMFRGKRGMRGQRKMDGVIEVDEKALGVVEEVAEKGKGDVTGSLAAYSIDSATPAATSTAAAAGATSTAADDDGCSGRKKPRKKSLTLLQRNLRGEKWYDEDLDCIPEAPGGCDESRRRPWPRRGWTGMAEREKTLPCGGKGTEHGEGEGGRGSEEERKYWRDVEGEIDDILECYLGISEAG